MNGAPRVRAAGLAGSNHVEKSPRLLGGPWATTTRFAGWDCRVSFTCIAVSRRRCQSTGVYERPAASRQEIHR